MAPEHSGRTELPLQYFLENEYQSLIEIFHWVTNLAASVYTDTTAIVPPEAGYASTTISPNHLLAQEFLLNFKRSSLDLTVPAGVAGYFDFPARSSLTLRPHREEEDGAAGRIVKLPPYQNVNASLGVTVRARRSRRQFSDRAMPLRTLSTILYYANGVTGELPLVSEDNDLQWPSYALGSPGLAHATAASSGGGLNPVSLYLMVERVEGLTEGTYVYLPSTHSLKRLRAADEQIREEHRALGQSWGPNLDPSTVGVAVYYVYSVYENARKYGDLGLLFAAIEAGEMAAHIHLISTATNVGSSDLGGWEKVPTERFLGLDGLSKQLIHATVLGMAV